MNKAVAGAALSEMLESLVTAGEKDYAALREATANIAAANAELAHAKASRAIAIHVFTVAAGGAKSVGANEAEREGVYTTHPDLAEVNDRMAAAQENLTVCELALALVRIDVERDRFMLRATEGGAALYSAHEE